MVERPLDFLLTFLLRAPPLEVRREHWESFPYEAAKGTLISSGGVGNGASLELWRDHRCSSRGETALSGNFVSCCKGMKDPFEVQEGRCDFPQNAAAEKGLISPGGENLLVFLELWQVLLELRRRPQGPTRVASGKASLHTSCEGYLGIPHQSVPGPKSTTGAKAGT